MSSEIIVRTLPGREHYLRRALESLKKQTAPAFRTILVQDGGESVFPAVADLLELLPSYEFILIENGGNRSHAANVGIDACKGEFLGFLDDDDFLEENHIELLENWLRSDPSLAAVYAAATCRYVVRNGNDEKLISAETHFDFSWQQDALLLRNLFPIQAVLLRRSEISSRRFSENLDALEDWAFWVDTLLGKKIQAIPEITSAYCVPANLTDNMKRSRTHEECWPKFVSLRDGYAIDANRIYQIIQRYKENSFRISGVPVSELIREIIYRGNRFGYKVFRYLQRKAGLDPHWPERLLNYLRLAAGRRYSKLATRAAAPSPISKTTHHAKRLAEAFSAEPIKGAGFGISPYVVFTSCNLHYLPKARVLAKSVRQHRPDAEFHLVLADRIPNWLIQGVKNGEEPFDAVFPLSSVMKSNNIRRDVFKYTVVELCTILKPLYLENIYFNEYKNESSKGVIYFDPDVRLFGRCESAFEGLAQYPAVITPHCPQEPLLEADIWINERSANAHGIFNLGFIALANNHTGIAISRYWARRAALGCYDEIAQGIFTDQKWMNHLPIHFPEVLILRDPTYNLASWNIGPVDLKYQNKDLFVGDKIVNFFHYSGFDKNVIERIAKILHKKDIVELILKSYDEEVKVNALPDSEGEWTFGFYENGEVITRAERRLYRENTDIINAFANPFSIADTKSFRNWTKAQRKAVIFEYDDKNWLKRHF